MSILLPADIPFGFRRDKEHTRVPVIPKPHRDKEGNGGENGFGKGQDDAEKNPEIPRAVDDRRRFEILRKSHKVRAHDEHIEHTHIRGEIHHFARIPKPQLFYDQIIGNHAAAEIHGEQKIDEKNLFSGQFSPRQRIGGKRRYDQIFRFDMISASGMFGVNTPASGIIFFMSVSIACRCINGQPFFFYFSATYRIEIEYKAV